MRRRTGHSRNDRPCDTPQVPTPYMLGDANWPMTEDLSQQPVRNERKSRENLAPDLPR